MQFEKLVQDGVYDNNYYEFLKMYFLDLLESHFPALDQTIQRLNKIALR